tara:strand:- start:859 stop:1122 length:264 start_codon:yes stop_codon:yes gene_type:complete
MTNSNLPTLAESQGDRYCDSETSGDENWQPPKRILHLRADHRGQWLYALSDNYDLLDGTRWQYGSSNKNETIEQARERFGSIDGVTT